MRVLLPGMVLIMAASLCTRAEEPNMAGQEARLAAAALVRQNDALRVEIARLREEVGKLTFSLAQAKAELDEARVSKPGAAGVGLAASADRPESPAGAATLTADSWLITEVNPDLKLVVIDAGRVSGLKQGMNLYALRGEKPGARLRVVDVRERISGAVIEEIMGAGSPVKGDRAVLVTAPK